MKKKTEPVPEVKMPDAAELPYGWKIEALKSVTKKVPTLKPESEPDRLFGYVDISSINNETNRIVDFKKIRGVDAPSRARQSIQPNDILFSNVRTYLRNIAIVPEDLEVQVCSTGFTVLRSDGSVDPKFLFYYTLTNDFINGVTPQQTGSQYPATTDRVVKDASIPFPSIPEQQRIVARVEALLTQINAARERLSRVPLIMKKFRQAVLAAACEGRLTEGWREEQKNLVTAADLYNRIQTIRMKKYEQAVIEAKKLKKRVPPKPSFLENCDPDSSTTTEIPGEWIWKKVVNLGPLGEDTVKTGPFGAILKSKEFVSSGVPIIAIGNVQWGKFDLDGARVDHVPEEKASELENYRVRTGDVLFTRSGTIGRSLVVSNFADHWLMSYHLLRVRADPDLIVPQYLYFVFAGCESSKEYTSDATIGSTRPGINTTILENLPVPLPPLAEQHEIVRRVGLLFERADAIDREVAAAGRRCERMTQAVLGKAFAGKL